MLSWAGEPPPRTEASRGADDDAWREVVLGEALDGLELLQQCRDELVPIREVSDSVHGCWRCMSTLAHPHSHFSYPIGQRKPNIREVSSAPPADPP